MNIKNVERALKRYLKRKITYTLSLLVTFLISGEITLGSSLSNIQLEKKELLKKIRIEKKRIQEKIDDNLKEIKKIDKTQYELVKKADWYSKPIFESTQVEVSFSKKYSGNLRDRTEKEFKITLDAIKNEAGGKDNYIDLNTTNGVVVDDKKHVVRFDIGPTIKPNIPILPKINPDLSKDILIPVVKIGLLPEVPAVNKSQVILPTEPNISQILQPNGVDFSIVTPEESEKIQVIVPIVTKPVISDEKVIEVITPTTPSNFSPIVILAPSEPIISLPSIITPSLINYPGFGGSIGDKYDYWGGGNSSTMIDQISITRGKFKATSGVGAYSLGYQGKGGISATSSTIVRGNPTGVIPSDGNNILRRNFFFGIRNSAFIEWAPEVEISWFTGLGNQQLLYMETATISSQTLDSLNAGGVISSYLYNEVTGYKNQTNLYDNFGGAKGINLHNNKGKIYLGDSDTRYQATTTISGTRLSVFNNDGTITGLNIHNLNSGVNGSSKQVVYFNTPDTSNYQKWIYANGANGKISLYGSESIAMYYTSSSGNQQQYVETGFVNNGEINLYGINSSGVMIRASENLKAQSGLYLNTPINIYSDGSRGVYIAGNISNLTSSAQAIVRVKIGENKNDVDGIVWNDIETGNDVLIESNGNINGSSLDNVDNAVGVMYTNRNVNAKIQTPDITLEKFSKNSIGIYVAAGKLNIDNGNIYIKGGEKNIAILSKADIANGLTGGDINYIGDITISSSLLNTIGGTEEASSSIAAYIEGKTFDMTGNVDVDSKDSVTLYVKDGNININGNTLIKSYGKDTIALYANNGRISANRKSLSGHEDIFITGDSTSGVGLYTTNNGIIDTQKMYIKVKNGSAGIASTGVGSLIDLEGGILEFDGSGYAVYSDGNGRVNLSSSKIILKGSSTAFDLDLSPGIVSPITLDSDSRIHVGSNDVVVFNLKNANNLNTTGLESSITGALGGALGGVNLTNLIVADTEIDKYKTAAVDGGTIIIGNLDKTGIGKIGESQAQEDGNFYYNRFLGQRLVATTAPGSTILAILDTQQSEKFNKQIVGLEMNSSKLATTNIETSINLVNSTIKSDRTDVGTGAIGIFINYGLVTVDSTSNILVEKERNIVNPGAIGIYSVNGSEVTNNGNIDVSGSESIGILGMAYRETIDGNSVINEFGLTALNQGKLSIYNNKNITLDGTGSIGIYAKNNNTITTNTDALVINTSTGIITVGNSDDTRIAVGIYGEKATISNLGTISIGDDAVAIYGIEESNITDLGTLDLGSGSIGIYADGTTNITGTSVILTSNNDVDLKGKKGVFYKGTGLESKIINLDIDASNFDKGIALAIENMNIESQANIIVGKDGIGIYTKGTDTNIIKNTGTIDLTIEKLNAIGIYTKSTVINNVGIISVNDVSQIGMFAESIGKIINTGLVDLKGKNSTGIYIRNGGTAELGTGNRIIFNGSSGVGVFADIATINITGDTSLVNNNENKNILIYGKEATINIDAEKTVTIDGVTSATTIGNKTIGAYLENTGIFNGRNGVLDVKNEAIGVYSKGNNTLSVNIVATGEKTIGVFGDGASKITGEVIADGGAVGIYGIGGIIDGIEGLTLSTTTGKGIGMYLVDGASVLGTVNIKNTSSEKNIGVYYSKGIGRTDVTNSANININENNSIGLYVTDGITLINNGNIVTKSGKNNNIGSFVGNGAHLISKGNVSMNDNDSIGLVARADIGKIAIVENIGNIKVGSNLGMHISGKGTNIGINMGTVDTTGTIGKGTGIYIQGENSSFNGTNGIIKSDGIGIYLKDTVAEKVISGDLMLGNGAVAVFVDNGTIDFTVDTIASTGVGVVGVIAKNNSTISKNIKIGQNSIGAYLLDDTVTFNGATIKTELNNSATSIGILLDESITSYTLNNISINADTGIGLYLNSPTLGLRDIVYSATITTEKGIGIFVDNGNILSHGVGVININGGTGIYVADGGIVKLGVTTDILTFNFLTDGGVGVFSDGGTLTLGDKISVTGSGSLAVTKNGDSILLGNFDIGEGATGVLGEYDSITTSTKKISNVGIITAHSGGKGLIAIKGLSTPTGLVIIENKGNINVLGELGTKEVSIGIYTDMAAIDNEIGIVSVKDNGIGIFADNTTKDVNAGYINLTGTDGIGVYIKGAIESFTSNNITGTGTGIIYEGIVDVLSIGTITLGNGSKGIIINGTGSPVITPTILTGTITVGDSYLDKSAIGVVVQNGANIALTSTKITSGGIGIFANEATVSDVNLRNITIGTKGVYVYSENSDITLSSGNFIVDDRIGIYAKGSSLSVIGDTLTTTVLNGGLGIYLENGVDISLGDVIIQNGLGNGKQSIGIYYKNMTEMISLDGIKQSGDYTIGSVLETTDGIVENINLISSSNSVGIALKGNSNLTIGSIMVNGNKNIGVHSLGGSSTLNGDVYVFDSLYSNDKSLSSIGIFSKNGSITTAGNVIVGTNSIGIYGEVVENISISGNIISEENTLGIYGLGNSGNSTLNITGTKHQIGSNNAIGVFGENINTTLLGDFIIGNGISIGVVSKGNSNLNMTGNMAIGESSIGIYKINGSGDVTVGAGTFVVDKKGYGIYLAEVSGNVINNAEIILGESSIGIYSRGTNIVNNNGIITVGKTSFGPNNNIEETINHLNSVGIFMSERTTAKNTGTINVTETLSVGVYSNEAGNSFENTGTINVDNGGIGILVKNGAIAVNEGIINVGGTSSTPHSIGMAAYIGSTIINNSSGIINVTDGIGMLVGSGGILDNKGTINIVNGVGIYGDGQIKNSGTIKVTGSGTEILDGIASFTGGIQIDKAGNVIINDNYVSIGGTLVVDGSLDVNGSFVDITTGKPVFEANNITGNVNILPNFALSGNGYTYEIEGFLNSLSDNIIESKVTPILSPMWATDVDRDGNLIIVKKPYADLTIGNQFNNLDKGLDNILMGSGNTEDKEILKNINYYLSGLSNEDYEKEAGRVLGETRGDIYSTIQMRMNTINDAFNSSFSDLESLYNLTKDSNKYGLIYSAGDFKDSTVGINDYKYSVTGLMYVYENEQVEYKSKFGHSLGFVVSKFDFSDDGKSKEDVYSLRGGIHKVKLLENEIELGTYLNATYNYHKANRKMALGYGSVENRSKYQTYSLELNNKLTKELYNDYEKNVKIYTGLQLGYGVLNSFKEKGNLTLEVKSNDFFSLKPEIGISSEYKFSIGENSEVSLFGSSGLKYELGEVYNGNKARLREGEEYYYSLITPEKEKRSLEFKVGIKFEQFNKFDIILETEGVVAENKNDIDMKYSIKINYIF